MRKGDFRTPALALALLVFLTACGRKGDPSPRRTPQDTPKATVEKSAPGAASHE